MMQRRISRTSLVVLMFLIAMPRLVSASDYLIEAVVFSWAGGARGDESFEQSPDELVPMPKFSTPPDNLVQRVQPSLLANALAKMNAANSINVIEHLAWTQSRANKRGSPQIDMGAAPGSRIKGWVRLYTNTYLYADVDLAFQNPVMSGGGTSGYRVITSSDGGSTTLSAGGTAPAPYRLVEHRRVKFNELHYFDHPAFGVLLTISPNKP